MTLDGTTIEDFETLAEISKVEEIYLLSNGTIVPTAIIASNIVVNVVRLRGIDSLVFRQPRFNKGSTVRWTTL